MAHSFIKTTRKCGSGSTSREFRRLVQKIAIQDKEHNHMPDYAIVYDHETDMVIFHNRGQLLEVESHDIFCPSLRVDTHEVAKKLVPGWDVCMIEQEWRNWLLETPRDADKAFIGFCAKWFK